MEVRSTLKEFYKILLNLIFPEKNICFICDRYDEEIGWSYLCNECGRELVFIDDNKCSKCGKPLELGYSPNICPDCKQNHHYFEKAVAPLEYIGLTKKAIYKYKYNKKSYMYKLFGKLIVRALKDSDIIHNVDLVVPIPLYRKKKLDRGFNQAELLTKYIAKELNFKMSNNNLVRIRRTSTQNKLSKLARRKNVLNAFKIRNEEAFEKKRILLIDDILTTGATVDECSKLILRSGAQKVYVATVATGRNV